jgi:surface antigen
MIVFSVSANESSIELLAGVEAGIETQTSMSDHDLIRTQLILSQEKIGATSGWFNADSNMQYDITINQQYKHNQRSCLGYSLSITQGLLKETKQLNACKNVHNQWISTYEDPTKN